MNSEHADILNALDQMQKSPHYAARRSILAQAEQLIVAQERELATHEWIKCSERLPEKDQRVLYYFMVVGIHAGRFKYGTCQGDALFASAAGFLSGDVTHWMPLPEAPK